MAKLAELRKQAKELGIAPGIIRACDSADELQSVIDGFGGDGKPAKAKGKGKGAVKKSVAKKAVAKSKGNSKSASSKSAPAAKSAKGAGKAKRPTAVKTQSKGTDGPSGRHLLDGVDFSVTDGWNARQGSAPDRIVKALRKFKGNRAKVYDFLVDDLWDFVGKKKNDGSKRSKSEAEEMLRYRISRTAWDFAMRTGQHEKSDNRAEYGTAGTGSGAWKPAKGKSKASTNSRPKPKGKGKTVASKVKAAPKATAKPKGKTATKGKTTAKGKTAATKGKSKVKGKGKSKK